MICCARQPPRTCIRTGALATAQQQAAITTTCLAASCLAPHSLAARTSVGPSRPFPCRNGKPLAFRLASSRAPLRIHDPSSVLISVWPTSATCTRAPREQWNNEQLVLVGLTLNRYRCCAASVRACAYGAGDSTGAINSPGTSPGPSRACLVEQVRSRASMQVPSTHPEHPAPCALTVAHRVPCGLHARSPPREPHHTNHQQLRRRCRLSQPIQAPRHCARLRPVLCTVLATARQP